MTTYPWQERAWRQLHAATESRRLPHALLLTGPEGCGKGAFAMALARALLCATSTSEGTACGRCRDCEWLAAGTHPNLIQVGPEEDSSAIKIDQIRGLIEQIALTAAGEDAMRVVLVRPADAMNRNAANSLLKTLEEPPLRTVLILVSHAPATLPATIRSRCQRIDFGGERALKIEWLRGQLQSGIAAECALGLANGGPLLALAMEKAGVFAERGRMMGELRGLASGAVEPITTAARWSGLDVTTALRVLISLVQDLIRSKLAGPAEQLQHADLHQALQATAERIDLSRLTRAHALLLEQWRLHVSGANVRPQDMLEDFALLWTE
jgi:DNA polymerase-3 subunit delta'